MKPDDELCFCFHVSWRKILNYLRIHRVRHASELSECFGAGTGCGWCRKQLIRLTEIAKEIPPEAHQLEAWLDAHSPGKQAYTDGRKEHLKNKSD